ncbi:unnamed protein product [Symbiodinium natans]|uniref:Uncharacterized protein n=1 Tax=Symbiodinium natans TaxID=878477 RepID=A0A812N577_9DINO|nr:unnamed protein product [Symbiodinium natans]
MSFCNNADCHKARHFSSTHLNSPNPAPSTFLRFWRPRSRLGFLDALYCACLQTISQMLAICLCAPRPACCNLFRGQGTTKTCQSRPVSFANDVLGRYCRCEGSRESVFNKNRQLPNLKKGSVCPCSQLVNDIRQDMTDQAF